MILDKLDKTDRMYAGGGWKNSKIVLPAGNDIFGRLYAAGRFQLYTDSGCAACLLAVQPFLSASDKL